MIGDKIFLDAETPVDFGSFPGPSGNLINLKKVNQDGYSSEYRFSDTAGRWILKIRNSIEPPRTNAGQIDRHNVELTYQQYADPDTGLPAISYTAYIVYRIPAGGDFAVMKTLIGGLANLLSYDTDRFAFLPAAEPGGYVDGPVGGLVDKVSNFES